MADSSGGQIELAVCYPDLPARVHTLAPDDRVTVGRGDDVQLQIDHPSISRQHAELHRPDRSALEITDFQSKNGSFVADRRIQSERITLDDRPQWLRFGEIYVRASRALMSDMLSSRWQQLPSGPSDPASAAVSSLLRLTGYRRACIATLNAHGEWQIHERSPDNDWRPSHGACDSAFKTQSPVYQTQIKPGHWLSQRYSIVADDTQAVIAVPLIIEGDCVGVLYADHDQADRILTELEVEVLQSLASHCAMHLALNGLKARLRQLERPLASADAVRFSLADSPIRD